MLLDHAHGNRLVASQRDGSWVAYLVWGDGAADGRVDYAAGSWDALLVAVADGLGRNQVYGAHEELAPLLDPHCLP